VRQEALAAGHIENAIRQAAKVFALWEVAHLQHGICH
jgi:hypothetical protein